MSAEAQEEAVVSFDGNYSLTVQSTNTASLAACVDFTGDIVIPDSVKASDGETYQIVAISDSSFKNQLITSVELPAGVASIGKKAFAGCSNLKTITLSSDLTLIDDSAFSNSAIESISLPISLSYVGNFAFGECANLKSIAFPKNVSYIGEHCVSGCSSLETIVIEDGTKLEKWVTATFDNASAVTKIVLGDGISFIGDQAFSGLAAIESISLPNTLTSIGNKVFDGCVKLQTIKCYAVNPPYLWEGAFNGIGVDQITVYVPNDSKSAYKATTAWGSVTSPTLVFDDLYTFVVADEVSDTVKFDVSTAQDFVEAFAALSDANSGYENATFDIENDVTFDKQVLDYGVLSAENIYTVIDKLPTIAKFDGIMNGAKIDNLTARSAGFFGTIGEDAEVSNLSFDNATLYADLTNSSAYTQDGDKIYIPLLAKTINGKVNGFGFTGDIIVDADLAKDKDITVYLADGAGENAEINGFVYLDFATTGTNKRCITIKQNLGVRNSKTAKIKMAKQKLNAGGNKSLDGDEYDYSDDELCKMVREFDDSEFASGVVAFWLNYEGAGYTGNYTARWSQGKTVPIAATTKNGVSDALYAVDYGTTDMTHITSGKRFANNGSQITIGYDAMPESITVGDTKVVNFGATSVTLTFDHSKPINIDFSAKSTAEAPNVAENITVSVNGHTVTVSGADGLEKTIFGLSGAAVASSTGSELSVPAAGVYVVRVGARSFKVVLK